MCPFYHVYFTLSTDWPWPLKCRFHPEVTSCLLSRGKTKYATLGMRLWHKYIRNYLLVYQLISHFLPYLQNYKELEGEISDLQLEKYGLSFETKKYTTSGWARGDENVIGIRAFNVAQNFPLLQYLWIGCCLSPVAKYSELTSYDPLLAKHFLLFSYSLETWRW